MTAITWQPVNSFGEQLGTCPEGVFTIQPPDAGGRVPVHFSPKLPDGQDLGGVFAKLQTFSVWTPESNRLAAMYALMNGGSRVGYFNNREAAHAVLEKILGTDVPEDSLRKQFAVAGFLASVENPNTYQRLHGTSTFEVQVQRWGVSLIVFKTPSRWHTIADLNLPVAQHHPTVSVGIFPGERATLPVFAAAVIAATEWAIAQGIVSAPRRPAGTRRA